MDGEIAEGARILVVEAEPNARAAVVALLRDAGYVADGAADEAQAQASIAAARPDLVLADVTGQASLERMSRLRGADAAVVAMTPFGSVDAAVAAVERGADDYLSKPIDRRELLQVTRRTLACRALERETIRLRRALEGRAAAREPSPIEAPAIPGASLRAIERFAIERTLAQVGGSDREAAKILGITRRELRLRIAGDVPA
jgi:DNA-binding NtrC family response regulator